jgi:hypothetical protein
MTLCFGENKSERADIIVDFSSENGRINKNVFGISTNPTELERKWPPIKEAGFKFIEVNVLVDEKLISIVTENPQVLNRLPFVKIMDLHLQKIYEIGAEPMIWFLYQAKPIKNLEGLAAYTKYIVKHITEGFGDGGKWPVRFFRFGNEPDNPEYWKGTPEQFYEMFAVWSKTIKSMNPDFVVIGPGLVSICERGTEKILDCSKANKWTKNFLGYLEKHKSSLDIFTFHAYSPVIYDFFYRQPLTLYDELKKYPSLSTLYGIPKMGNDEWNVMVGDEWSGRYNEEFDTVSLAAHNIAALTAMIEGGVELSIRYGGTDSPGHDYVMVKKDYKNYKHVYYAFKGFNMLSSTPIKLGVKGSNFLNLTALAGKSENENEITIVISSFDISDYLNQYVFKVKKEDAFKKRLIEEHYNNALKILNIPAPITYNGYRLNIKNLGWKGSDKIEYKLFIVDEKTNFDLMKNEVIKGGNEVLLSENLTTPSVHVIRIKRLSKN